MRRIRFVVIRLKGQHTVNSLSQPKEEKKRNEGQTFNLTSDYLNLTRIRKREIYDFVFFD